MKWDLPERTEDAIVAYLKAECTGSLRISAAWERDEMEYPAVLVHVVDDKPVSEEAEWDDNRECVVEVAVITEGAHELNLETGETVRSAREINAIARSSVMDALFVPDLLARIVAQGVADIAFSMMQFSGSERSTEDRNLITTITGTAIVEPVTGS